MTADPSSPLATADGQREAAAVELDFTYANNPTIDKHLRATQALAHAQIAISLDLADIAASLRILAGRPQGGS